MRRDPPGGGRSRRPAAAFTLIEVILAIGLAAVLLGLLTGAVGLYAMRLQDSRAQVARGQLARGILRLIADDLRAAATVMEQDISPVERLAASQGTFDVDQLDRVGETGPASVGPTASRRPVGLYGDASQFQVDVCRTRAADPVIAFGDGEQQAPTPPLRGVTTVRYFVGEAGLVRQEASREVEVFETGAGSVSATLEASGRVIAPEVTELRLRYSDGEQTLDAWDAEQMGGLLPAAVELRLLVRDTAAQGAGDTPPAPGRRDLPPKPYRIVVALPEANAPAEAEADNQPSNGGAYPGGSGQGDAVQGATAGGTR